MRSLQFYLLSLATAASFAVFPGVALAQQPSPAPIKAQASGVLQLDAQAATIHGKAARFLVLEGIGNVCYWTNPADWISWKTSFDRAGEVVVELKFTCANSYLDHLDRVRDDANYAYAQSECNNLIAIANFQPQRFAELKERVKQGRVELVNAFFLESTVNLSGGEALAKMGIEGLRWQQQVMGARPRFCWAIDTCGVHAQMPQLCEQLGLDALVYCRAIAPAKQSFGRNRPTARAS